MVLFIWNVDPVASVARIRLVSLLVARIATITVFNVLEFTQSFHHNKLSSVLQLIK